MREDVQSAYSNLSQGMNELLTWKREQVKAQVIQARLEEYHAVAGAFVDVANLISPKVGKHLGAVLKVGGAFFTASLSGFTAGPVAEL